MNWMDGNTCFPGAGRIVRVCAASDDLNDQALQVVRLGDGQQNRMILGPAPALQNAESLAGIERGFGQGLESIASLK